MLFPQISKSEWIMRFPALTPMTKRCQKCRKHILETDQPFINKRWVGLISSPCACGYKGLMVMIGRDDKFNQLMDSLTFSDSPSETTADIIINAERDKRLMKRPANNSRMKIVT